MEFQQQRTRKSSIIDNLLNVKSRRSSVPSPPKIQQNSGGSFQKNYTGSVYGKSLQDLRKNTWILDQNQDGGPCSCKDINVPQYLLEIIKYLEQNLEIEGLFRRDGAKSRQKARRPEIEELETFVIEGQYRILMVL